MNQFELSKRSQSFIEDLRVYLFSSGKKEEEIDEIVTELEDHLIEAEKRGKSTEDIVGKTPKTYMQQLSNEMKLDYKTWIKYFAIIVTGAFSITIIDDILNGPLTFSLLEIGGYLAISIVFIFLTFGIFKFVSSRTLSYATQGLLFFLLAIVPLGLFVGLEFATRAITSPVIAFGHTGTWIVGILTIIFLVGVSIWSKTLILPVVVVFLTLPEYLLGFTNMNEEAILIWGTIITFSGIGAYLLLSLKHIK
ncbi:HAAS domain-containing protein [Oceanobacillus kapialis]|uniref:HAAS domain-containing protein n=1 Tax=Oceanobacillus kapialis TaxID=481353 RepID=UPI00384D0CAF